MPKDGRKRQGPADERHDDGPWIEPEDALPRLILMGPDRIGPDFLASIADALAAGSPAALLIDQASLGGAEPAELLPALAEAAHGQGSALFLRGDAALVINSGADGLLVGAAAEVEPARRVLGASRVIGCACGTSRHLAMEAGEAGADFVLFGTPGAHDDVDELAELAAWWALIFVIPVAVAVAPVAARITAVGRQGADFLLTGGELWNHPEDVAHQLGELAGALAAIPSALPTTPSPPGRDR